MILFNATIPILNIVIISVGMYLDVGNGHQVYIMVQDKLTVWQILQRFQLHNMVKFISFNSASAPSSCFVKFPDQCLLSMHSLLLCTA